MFAPIASQGARRRPPTQTGRGARANFRDVRSASAVSPVDPLAWGPAAHMRRPGDQSTPIRGASSAKQRFRRGAALPMATVHADAVVTHAEIGYQSASQQLVRRRP
jgi:hypothetical protein